MFSLCSYRAIVYKKLTLNNTSLYDVNLMSDTRQTLMKIHTDLLRDISKFENNEAIHN